MSCKPINTGIFSSDNMSAVAGDLLDNSLGAISPFNEFGKYFTGSRAIIKINDKLFGFAFSVNYSINTSQDEIWTIDDYTPFELAPKKITVEGTIGMFHIPGKGPTRQFVQSNVLSFLFHKYITIDIQDQTTGQTIFKTEKAVITSKSQNINAGELSRITLQWKAIGWSDDITPAYPQGHSGDDSKKSSGTGETLADLANDAKTNIPKSFSDFTKNLV